MKFNKIKISTSYQTNSPFQKAELSVETIKGKHMDMDENKK